MAQYIVFVSLLKQEEIATCNKCQKSLHKECLKVSRLAESLNCAFDFID